MKRCFALTAAWVFSLAAVGAQPAPPVSAEDTTVPSFTVAPKTEDGDEAADPLGALEIKPDLGTYTFYRWERVRRNNYPTDDKEYRSLLLATYGPGGEYTGGFVADHDFVNGMAPECIWLGNYAPGKPTVPESNRKQKSFLETYVNTDYLDWETSLYISANYNIETANQIRPGQEVFYTTNDYNTPYVQLAGMDNKNWNEDGSQCRTYTIRLKSSNSHKYYIWGNDEGDGTLDVDVDGRNMGHSWTFQCRHKWKDVWEIFKEEDGVRDDECLVSFPSWGMSYINDRADHSGCLYSWFIGEEMTFSGIKEKEFVIPKGMVYPVGKSSVIDSTKNETKTMSGILLNEGHKIVVKSGGILSVEGTLLNNGTIEVEAGGLLLVKKGGCICPFTAQSGNASENGDGAIRCLGDIIIQPGGSIFGGVGAEKTAADTEFHLDKGATLINQGLLVYGGLRLADSARLELYPSSVTMGSRFVANRAYIPIGIMEMYRYSNTNNEADLIKDLNSRTILGGRLLVVPTIMPTGGFSTYQLAIVVAPVGDSVQITDLLSKTVSTYMSGKDSNQLHALEWPAGVDSVHQFNFKEVPMVPLGLYVPTGKQTSQPTVKIMQGATFNDPFFQNKLINYMFNAEML